MLKICNTCLHYLIGDKATNAPNICIRLYACKKATDGCDQWMPKQNDAPTGSADIEESDAEIEASMATSLVFNPRSRRWEISK